MGGRMYPDDEKTRHYRTKRSCRYRPHGLAGETEVRYFTADRDEIDEIVTTTLHLEMMSDKAVWMEVNGLHVWFHYHKGRIRVTASPDDAEPFVVTPEMATALERLEEQQRVRD